MTLKCSADYHLKWGNFGYFESHIVLIYNLYLNQSEISGKLWFLAHPSILTLASQQHFLSQPSPKKKSFRIAIWSFLSISSINICCGLPCKALLNLCICYTCIMHTSQAGICISNLKVVRYYLLYCARECGAQRKQQCDYEHTLWIK